jgi:hypothetical protein
LKFVRTLWGRAVPVEFDLPHVSSFGRNPRHGIHFCFQQKKISFGYSLREEEMEWVVGELEPILKQLKEDPPVGAE